jgi:hypothetical protein
VLVQRRVHDNVSREQSPAHPGQAALEKLVAAEPALGAGARAPVASLAEAEAGGADAPLALAVQLERLAAQGLGSLEERAPARRWRAAPISTCSSTPPTTGWSRC